MVGRIPKGLMILSLMAFSVAVIIGTNTLPLVQLSPGAGTEGNNPMLFYILWGSLAMSVIIFIALTTKPKWVK